MSRWFVALMVVALLVMFYFTVRADAGETEKPVQTSFTVKFVRIHPVGSDDLARDRWTWMQIGAGRRMIHIDLNGQVVEYQLDSWTGSVPADVKIEGGKLLVTEGGRTYRHSPHGRIEHRLVLSPVTRMYSGPLGYSVLTLPELAPVPTYVETSQWVEVRKASPPKKLEPMPTPVDDVAPAPPSQTRLNNDRTP